MASKAKAIKQATIDLDGQSVGEVTLNPNVFALPVRADLLHRVVNYQLANRRVGTHRVKSRGEVRGSTRKQFRQKGTGNARRGDGKVSQFRGGGVAFGPKPRTHEMDLPKKIRRLALKTALSERAGNGKLVVLAEPSLPEPKTKMLDKKLKQLGWGRALVIGDTEFERNFALASRNIIALDLMSVAGANVYDILRHDTLVLTQAAVERLTERLA